MKLNHINNITSLEELAVYYDDIIKHTRCYITKDENLYGDIVNNVILKCDKQFKKGKIINGGFLAITLKNEYIDHLRSESKTFHSEIPDTRLDDSNESIQDEEDFKIFYEEFEKKYNELSWYQKKIIEFKANGMSLLELSRQTKISYRNLLYHMDKVKTHFKDE